MVADDGAMMDDKTKARALLVTCPFCDAAPGTTCKLPSGKPTDPHYLRAMASEGRRR